MRLVSPRYSPNPRAGLTLVEVLMSMLVAGIGVLSVIVLLPLSFVRAIQAVNLTNGTILRYNGECLADANPSLFLRWQANQTYAVGDTIVVSTAGSLSLTALNVTTAGTSGISPPLPWNTTPAATTTDNTVVWTAAAANQYTSAIIPTGSQYPPCFVIDPMGWNTLGAPLQTNFGNNGAGAIDPNAVPRFNGELASLGAAAVTARLPDSWIEQARGPVTAFTTNTVTLTGPDLSSVGFSTPAVPGATIPITSRVVMLDVTGKTSATRIITGVNPATGVITWGGGTNDPLPASFTPVSARVETQDTRYTWIFTVHPNPPPTLGSTTPSWNVTATIFFNRPLVAADEQVYQATGADGTQTPFTVNYPAGQKPFIKKGGFLFDCYFGRWYRVINTANDTGSSIQVYVDSSRPQTDVLTNLNFGAVFMRGVIDQYPLMPK